VHPAIALGIAYASGSVPAAFLAGKWRGVDLRTQGSGNLGATNVLRTMGPRIGAAVFAVDIAKGALPVQFIAPMTGLTGNSLTLLQVVCGVAAILGHARPLFLGFSKGGKGVATACGVFLALAPIQALLSLLVFAVVVGCSGYVSLASISGALALPTLLAASAGPKSPVFVVGALATAFVVWMHGENIKRLRAGTEYRFSKSAGLSQVASMAVGAFVLLMSSVFLAIRGLP
jgi:glycerol-3-phosphate acyltransferase PlsY